MLDGVGRAALAGGAGEVGGELLGSALRSAGIPVNLYRPQGLTREQFRDFSDAVLDISRQRGLGDDIFVQGSRAAGTARPMSDIDIGIRVSPKKFDDFPNNGSKLGNPNPGSAAERTRQRAIETGKIQAGEARLRGQRKQLEEMAGMDVDLSIIREGGPFDNGAQTPLR